MIRKRVLIICIILGAIIGWALGFLRLPFIDKNHSFLLGFTACFAIVLLGIILLSIWKKNSIIFSLLTKNSETKDSNKATRTYTILWILVSTFIVFGSLSSGFLIFNQNKLFKAQTQTQNKRIQEQSELIESIRKSNLVFLMSSVLDKVDDELKDNSKGMLSDATIARITALSYSFKPYRYLKGDSLSQKKLSPERGQLLLALSIMGIDSISFSKIKFRAPFSEADLKGVDLKGVDLRGVNLNGADLYEADLRGANLKEADLREANFWGANLRKADLKGADLKRADLRWVNLNETDLRSADLNGANLSDAKLRKADLRKASLKWANLSGTFLNEANIEGGNLYETVLRRANFKSANLMGVDLRLANLSETNFKETNLTGVDLRLTNLSEAIFRDAILTNATLDKAIVAEENWFEKLKEWKVSGAEEIQEKYKIVGNKSGKSNYLLEFIKE